MKKASDAEKVLFQAFRDGYGIYYKPSKNKDKNPDKPPN